jgi:hypothetical protein
MFRGFNGKLLPAARRDGEWLVQDHSWNQLGKVGAQPVAITIRV